MRVGEGSERTDRRGPRVLRRGGGAGCGRAASPYRHRLARDRRRHLPRRGKQGCGEVGERGAPTVTASRGIGGDTSPKGGGEGAGRLGNGEPLPSPPRGGSAATPPPKGEARALGGWGTGSPYRHRLARGRRRHLPRRGRQGCGEVGERGEPLPSPPRGGSAATAPPEGEARARGVTPIGLRPLPPEGEARETDCRVTSVRTGSSQ